jgi:cell division protein FtsB
VPSTFSTRMSPYMPTVIIFLVIVYCGVQFLTGDKGFFSQASRNKDLAYKEQLLHQLKQERQDLEARAKYLRTDNLSKDLLEERARIILGFGTPNAYIIRVDKVAQNQG